MNKAVDAKTPAATGRSGRIARSSLGFNGQSDAGRIVWLRKGRGERAVSEGLMRGMVGLRSGTLGDVGNGICKLGQMSPSGGMMRFNEASGMYLRVQHGFRFGPLAPYRFSVIPTAR